MRVRVKHNLPDGVCNPVRNVLQFLLIHNLPDGVCNPIRNVLSIPGSKYFGRGCKPRPAIESRQTDMRVRSQRNLKELQGVKDEG